jgi:excisionase family DNA binding protein
VESLSWNETPLRHRNELEHNSHSTNQPSATRRSGSARLLTSKETAEILSIPEGTLRQWRCAGKGPVFIKLGGKSVRYNRTDLDEFIRQGRQVPSVRAFMEEQ